MLPNLAGKTALCVGATSGIGKGVAFRLAKMNANVTILARNQAAGKEMTTVMKSINPAGQFDVVSCDASSMKSIVSACDEFRSKNGKLNYCVLSQGLASLSGRNETEEGIDLKMALHYYGRMLVINELGELLRKAAATEETRVMSVLGLVSGDAYINLEDLELRNNFTLRNCAGATGFYNDLAFDQLSRIYSGGGAHSKNMSFVHVAPGAVATSWGSGFPFPLKNVLDFAKRFLRSPDQCAEVLVDIGLLGPSMGADRAVGGGSGGSDAAGFHKMSPTGGEAAREKAHSDANREAVWVHTQELLARVLAR